MIRRPESPPDVDEHPSVAVCDDLIAACPTLADLSGDEFGRLSEIIAKALNHAFAAGADAQRDARAEADVKGAPHELEPLRPLMDALHLELARRGGDRIEYLPEVPGHSPAMLRLGRVILSGMSAGALLAPLRDAALDFTQDCED